MSPVFGDMKTWVHGTEIIDPRAAANRISRLRKKIHKLNLQGKPIPNELVEEVRRYEEAHPAQGRKPQLQLLPPSPGGPNAATPGPALSSGSPPPGDGEGQPERSERVVFGPEFVEEDREGDIPPPWEPSADAATPPIEPGGAPISAGALAQLYEGLLIHLDRQAVELGCLIRIPPEMRKALTRMCEDEINRMGAEVVKPRQLVIGMPILVGVQNLGTKWVRQRRGQPTTPQRTVHVQPPAPQTPPSPPPAPPAPKAEAKSNGVPAAPPPSVGALFQAAKDVPMPGIKGAP